MMTPGELARVLEDLAVTVSEDTQIEWRRNKLLPSLTDTGRGRGAGKHYFYTDPRIAERAILVKKLLNACHSSDTTLLAIWVKGFEVDPSDIRNAWIRQLAAVQHRVIERIGSARDLSDVLARIATRVSREVGQRNHIPRNSIELMIETFVILTWNSNSIFGSDEREIVTADVESYFQHLALLPQASEILPQLNLEGGAKFLQRVGSLEGLQSLFASASPNQFAQALSYWLQIGSLVIAALAVFMPGLTKTDPDPRRDPAIVIGNTIIPMLLYGIQNRYRTEIESSINHILKIGRDVDIVAAINRVARNELVGEDLQTLRALFDGTAKIWGFAEIIELLLGGSGRAQSE